MRFQVPQFIEVEDKIFGPLTFKQFIYVTGGGGAVVASFILLPNFLAVIISIPIGLLAAALAFYQVNNRPFINMMESAFKYFTGSKLYVWQRDESDRPDLDIRAPKGKRLEDIGLDLEVKDKSIEQTNKTGKDL